MRGVGSGVAAGASIAMRTEGERLRQAYLDRRMQMEQELAGQRHTLERDKMDQRGSEFKRTMALRESEAEASADHRDFQRQATETRINQGDRTIALQEENAASLKTLREAQASTAEGRLDVSKDRLAFDEKRHQDLLDKAKEDTEKGVKAKGGMSPNAVVDLFLKRHVIRDVNEQTGEITTSYNWPSIYVDYFEYTGEILNREAGEAVRKELQSRAGAKAPAQAGPGQDKSAAAAALGMTRPAPSGASAAAERPPAQTAPAGVSTPTRVRFEDLERLAARHGISIQQVVKLAQDKGDEVLGLPPNFGPLYGAGKLQIR